MIIDAIITRALYVDASFLNVLFHILSFRQCLSLQAALYDPYSKAIHSPTTSSKNIWYDV